MKLTTETKAGIMVACSFLGLTGVFVGKKFLDPDGNVETLVSEVKNEGDPAKDASKGDVKGDPKSDPKGAKSEKEKPGEIVQAKSQVELPGGIPALPGTAIPAAIPAPVPVTTPPKDTLPGGLPPLPGAETATPKPMTGNVAKADGMPAFPPGLGEKSKSETLGSPPPPPPPPVSDGLPGGIPPLPGEMTPLGNIAKPATADSSKDKPGAVTSLPKNDKSELKSDKVRPDNMGPDLSKGFPPIPPSAGLGAVSGSSTGILGTAPPAPSGMPALESSKDTLKSGSTASRGNGSSEFSPPPSSGFALPERKSVPGNLSNPPLGTPAMGGSTLPTAGLGSPGLGSPGLGGRIASAAVIPPVAVTTFSPNTGPVKRTEFIPIDEPVAAPAASGGVSSGPVGPMATPPLPAPTGLPDLAPGGLSNNSGATKSVGLGGSSGFATNTPPVSNRPVLRMSGEEAKTSVQPAGLQYTPLNPQPIKTNTPNSPSGIGSIVASVPSKVSSWSEKVYNSVTGDTWETISQSQYQRRDLGRMLQSYNEIHPRLVALPKTGGLPVNTEVYLPPAEELIRQGASVVPTPTPSAFPNLAPPPAPSPLPSASVPPPGPLPSGLGGRP